MKKKTKVTMENWRECGQIVVFTGLLLPEEQREEFIDFIASDLGAEMCYLDEYETKAGNGGEGGRNDVLCRIRPDSVERYATARLGHGPMRSSWWEDHLDKNKSIIPSAVWKKYKRSW